MDQLNFMDLPPVRVTCQGCGMEWSGTAAWYTAGRKGCYQCFPNTSPTALDVARKAADRAQRHVANSEADVWKRAATDWLEDYLTQHPTLFVDDVWALGCPEPVNRKAVGPLIRSLAGRHLIVKSGEYRPRTQGHGSPADVWKSCIYRGRRTA
jgi:hypothetical protein